MTTGGAPRVKSADRTVELLELLAASPDRRTLVELSRDLEIPKSSMHGLLHTLVQRGWVETDTAGSRYGLGLQALQTGTAYLYNDRAIRRLTPVVDRLHHDLATTVQLGRLVGGYVVCLLTREQAGARPMLPAGRRTPAHATALGRVVLARIAVGNRTALTRMLPLTAASAPADLDALEDDLIQTAERGHAVDRGPGGCCVAVGAPPKLGPYDAIGVALEDQRLTDSYTDTIAEAVKAAISDGLTGRSSQR